MLARRCVGRADRRHVRQPRHLGEQRLGARAHRRVGDLAVVDGDHQLVGLTGRARRASLKQPDRIEALRVRQM